MQTKMQINITIPKTCAFFYNRLTYVKQIKYISVTFKVDKKATIRNRYNRIPHPALNTKRERDTYNKDGA